ncbi:acyl-coenzyme A thioesterase 13-like [Haemaphysalis longicornis]
MQRVNQFIGNVIRKMPYTKDFVGKVKPVACPRPGVVQFELRLEKEHCDLHGKLPPGMATALLDLYTWVAIGTLYEQNTPFVTLQMNTRYLAPAKNGDTILLDARVTHAGKTTVLAEMDILDKATKRCVVQGMQTLFILQI